MDINKAEQISNLYQKIQYYSNRIDSLTRSYNDEFSIHLTQKLTLKKKKLRKSVKSNAIAHAKKELTIWKIR